MIEDEIEIVRCPYCGQWTASEDIECPIDYCHHDIVELEVIK